MALERPLVSHATLCICGAAIGAIRDGPRDVIGSNRRSFRRCHAYSWITVRPFTGLRKVSTTARCNVCRPAQKLLEVRRGERYSLPFAKLAYELASRVRFSRSQWKRG